MALPTDYVLRVYLTEAAAKAGDTATALAIDGTGKILQSGQAAGYGFWTHTKYWYRIEANEPVKEFYIDWDDGEDNDPKGKANYTTIKLDTPAFVGITSHIYTGNSRISGGYFPKIRCKSLDGFWSKFYQNAAATPSATPISTGIDILQGETALTAGRNDKYRVESDYTTEERIPALYPTIKPPICVLKADKKRIYAGINNGWLSGADGELDVGGMTVILKSAPDFDSIRTNVEVRVTHMRTGLDNSTDADRGDISVTDMKLGGTNLSNVSKILKVELVNLLEDSVPFNGTNPSTSKLYPGEKMVLIANSYSVIKQQTIAEVSLGNPIVVLDDARYVVTYDLTESYARTPEQTISNYYLNDGEPMTDNGFTQSTDYQIDGVAVTAHSDYLLATNQELLNGVVRKNYSFDINHHYVDSDHRWLPTQLLARGQIKVNNPTGMTTPLVDQQYSFLEHWKNEGHTTNYSDTVDEAVAGRNWPSDITSSAVMAFKSTWDTDRWSDLEANNSKAGGASYYIMRSGPDAADKYYFGHEDADTLSDVDNRAMLVCARDSKWTKQHFKKAHNNTAVSQGRADRVIPGSALDNADGWDGVGHMNTRVQVFYSGHLSAASTPIWKPLKILNNTKHPDYEDSTWYTSGSFDWEEPTDWVSINPADIPNHYYPRGDYYTDAGDADNTSWAFSTHNQAGSEASDIIIPEVAEVTEVTIDTTPWASGGGDIAKLQNTYIVFSRGDEPETKDVFWFKTVSETAPDSEDLKTRHGDIGEANTINKIEVDIVSPVAATATITITNYLYLDTGDKVNLIATDGTNYDFTVGDQSSVNGTFEVTGSENVTATNLMNVINTSSGPAGTRFTATVSGAVVTATQATTGVAGNTTVTLTDAGTAGMTKTNFLGGAEGVTPSDADFAGVLQDEIDGNANYSATIALAVVTVTHSAAEDVFDAHKHNERGQNVPSVSVTTQGVDETVAAGGGHDYFETGDIWNATNKKYALMFLIETDSGAAGKADSYGYTDILHSWPCSNSHSILVDLIDPMCVSLNTFSMVQSISFVHKGKYQIVKDRLGKSDIRKIGSEGGSMKFGGIDLASETARAKFYEYQSQSTPVYIDVEHRNGDFSRFFGVLTEMSEDHPTGKLIPKFGVTMEVSHMITMNSSGNILSDGYISLGGNIDEPNYL